MRRTPLTTLLRRIRAVVFDFDGVFTDNRVIVDERGREAVVCNRSDGYGLARLGDLGVEMMVVSSEPNPVVRMRTRKLRIECRQGVDDKAACLREWCASKGIVLGELAYLGNDINDKDCLLAVGLPVVVADAYEEVKSLAKIVLTKGGGAGAVREFCDLVWRAKTERNERG